jgi:transcriptional regulator with XRE-family HTH domain
MVDKTKWVVVAETKTTMTLEKLEGDFTDYRKILGVTGSEMATLLGVTQSFVSKIEKGIKPVPSNIKDKCEELIAEGAKIDKKAGHKKGHKMTKNMTSDKAPKVSELEPIFKEGYEKKYQLPYGSKNGDYIQLNILRGRLGEMLTVDRWKAATTNYFLTDQSTHTLADLSSRFDTFQLGPLDRYGKRAENVKPTSAAPVANKYANRG